MQSPSESTFERLSQLLADNPELDLRTADLYDEATLAALAWGRSRAPRQPTLEQLRAYQRLLRVLPGPDHGLTLGLMARGITGAIQIAALPAPRFAALLAGLGRPDAALAARIHENARAVRARVLLTYVHTRQNREPHAVPAVTARKQ